MKLKSIDYLKENKIEFHLCKICGKIVDKSHFDSQEHIDMLTLYRYITFAKLILKNVLKMYF